MVHVEARRDRAAHGAGGSTTGAGAPARSDRNSLTIGADGPVLLHDVHFLEQMAHFNREKVIERQPHAKGSGAFGVFKTTEDVSAYTKATLFQKGAATDMLARFSTVAGEQGSPDTWRDVRGFSLKFYTTEGNYDLVGNNTPIFFVRDPMKFPHFIRSQKRLPDSGLRDNHMQWDFWTSNPESAHQVTYLMGVRGLPRSWRRDDQRRVQTEDRQRSPSRMERTGSAASGPCGGMPVVRAASRAASIRLRARVAAVNRATGLPRRLISIVSPAWTRSTSSLRRALASARSTAPMFLS